MIAARQETPSHSLSAHTKAVASIPSEKSKTHSLLVYPVEGTCTFQTNFFSGLSLPGKQTAVPQKILNTLQNLEVPYLSLLLFIHLIYARSKVQHQMSPFGLVTFPMI